VETFKKLLLVYCCLGVNVYTAWIKYMVMPKVSFPLPKRCFRSCV